MIGPRLAELGFSLMGSHLFLIYYAVLSAITPPVAVAAYAASAIARENPLIIAAYATRIAVVAFILPFIFVYSPALLMDDTIIMICGVTIVTCVAIIMLSVGIEGYMIANLTNIERLVFVLAAICGMTLTIFGVTLMIIAGSILLIKITRASKNIE